MTILLTPAVKRIRKHFTRAIADLGGAVSDSYDDGRLLFLRSVLPLVEEVRPRDRLQGGVALRVVEAEILVVPYVFRQVCRNGAIMAQALETRGIERVESSLGSQAEEEVLAEVSAAVQTCGSQEAFANALEPMRSASTQEVDLALNLMPLLTRLPKETAAQMLGHILTRYHSDQDRSRYGLMNAVTSLARDTRDPNLRWHLEELGGGIAALLPPVPKPDSGRLQAMRA
ncbi:MAG TPA: hypothetical protein VGY66_11875 [Gemmataceae bacterium]|jgi:hypothetical protein|nr:hypothetical protein [Gemmataceae bacterium]